MLRQAIYAGVDLALDIYRRAVLSGYCADDTCLISSSPRGGSTWLAEVVQRASHRLMIWEPFHLGYNPDIEEDGFSWFNQLDWREELDPSDPRYVYITKLLSGQDLSTKTLSKRELSLRDFLQFQGLLVKCVNAGMMIGWIAENFSLPCLHMVRNPCAVVSSQLKHGAFGHVENEGFVKPSRFLSTHPKFQDLLDGLNSQEELLAFTWCVQNYTAIKDPAPSLKTVSYETLVTDEQEMARVLEYFGCPIPEDLSSLTEVNSKTTIDTSKSIRSVDRTTAWKKALPVAKIDEVFRVVEAFGFELDDNTGVKLPAS